MLKSFKAKLNRAHRAIVESNLDVVEIPDSKGMKLVKVGSLAAADKDVPGNVLQTITLDGQAYFVCAS